LVVHALWSPGRGVLLWAEDGERPATGRSRALRRARPHPFAAPADALAALHPGTPTQVTLLLPAHTGGPAPSPELVRSVRAPAPRGEPALRPWAVPAVAVHPAELDDPADELRYGASVAHLRAVVAFADDLARRGHVLPTLDPGARARWRPVVQGVDLAAVEALAATMPPVARAELSKGASGPADPGALVADALDVLVDAAVRDRLARAGAVVQGFRGNRGHRGVVDAWLSALIAPDGRLPAATRTGPLAEAVAVWDAVGTEPPGAARACIRLAEVRALAEEFDDTGDGTHWRLEFLLQSTTDPSLLVPAAQVWSGGADRLIAGPQEVLLAELGRAARVYPPLAPALQTARPEGLDVSPEGAHHVLVAGAALLVDAGFGVQLPAGWDGARRVGLRLSARSTPAPGAVVRGGLGREEVAAFRWSLAVGDGVDAVLDEEEIAALVAAKAPLVRLRGAWVSVDRAALRRGLEFLRRGERRRPTAAEVLALATGVDDDLPLPLTGVDAAGWLGDLLAGSAERTLTPVEPPSGFTAQLRPYQQRGVAWLAFLSSLGLGACLADDMGLGKTVQLLAVEAHDREHEHPGPTLLLCPMSMVGTWEREAARFVPELRVRAHHGPARARGDDLRVALKDTDLLVTTYATAARDADDLETVDWHRLVLDEAQAVKNARSQPARAVRRFRARHRVALTGTPVENRLAELWSIMDVLNPGVLGTAERFRTRFAIPVERHGDTDAAELLRRTTRPYLLRRVKTDPAIVDDLPDKIEITQHYRLTREQASLYRTIVDDMMEKIEDSTGIARRGNVLAAMTKLKQVLDHPALLLHDGSPIGRRSGKVVRLEEILAEVVAEGDRALCFTQFAEFGHLLVPHLSARLDTDVAFLHGGVPRRRREEIVQRFQSGDGPPVLLASLKAGGTGLTLTAATHVVHLDRWWNPAVEQQATDRAYRIGQRRTVQVRTFSCPGTVEERIDALIRSKRALSEMIVTDGEGWLTELSTATLRELFTLSADALEDDDTVEPVRIAG
jgi:superfamily II DNA or RNA helicase